MTLAHPALIKATLGAGALLAVISLGAAYLAISELVNSGRQVGRAIRVLGTIEALRSDLAEARALQQRYLVTADEQLARDYAARRAALETGGADLSSLAVGEEQQRRARALSQAMAQLFRLLDETMEQRKRGAKAQFLEETFERGIGLAFQQIRVVERELIERGGRLQQERRAQAESEVRFTAALVAVAGACSLAMFGAAALLLGRFQRQRDRAQAELAALEERLEMAVAGSGLAVWDWDRGLDTVYLSEAWSNIVGGPPRATTTTPRALAALVPPEDQARVKASLDAINAGGQDRYQVEHRVRRDDGSYRWINSRGKVVSRDRQGRPVRITGTNADITQRKLAEIAQAASERELRVMANAVPAMIAYVDAGERYRFYNRAFERWLGEAAPGGVGRSVRELVGEARYKEVEPYLRRALSGEEVRFERRDSHPDGRELDLAVAYVPHRAENGAVLGIFALLSDITELKQIDRMKSEFVATVSHELRTPITAIRGSLGLLHAGAAGALPAEAAKLVGIADSSCQRLVRLVNDILDVEKIAAGKIEFKLATCDLVQLAQQSLSAIEAFAAERGVGLRLAREGGPASASADPDRVIQVLTNLISNAARFSPAGAAVELDIRTGAGMHRVSVRDRGPGVAAEFRPRLFQKFSQADLSNTRSSGGTGLGLAISKSIIERLGGRIGFEPANGGGAEFFFELPDAAAGGARA